MSRLTGMRQGLEDRMALAAYEQRVTTVNPGSSRTNLLNQMTLAERARGAISDVHSLIGNHGGLKPGELDDARFIISSTIRGW